MDIVIINHLAQQIYTNEHGALEGGRRQDIEKFYAIPLYEVVFCIYMPVVMSGRCKFNLIKIEDVRGAAVLIVELENNS